MKLYYFQFGDGVENFGDNLNHWLWERLLDGYLDDDDRCLFFGIGTLLNEETRAITASARRRVIMSTGVGYGNGTLRIDDTWDVYCVRGPLSAQALGLPISAAVTDGAMMLARLETPKPAKRWKFSFMPHIEQIADHAWRAICREMGLGYIDPRWPTLTVLHAIGETEVLITEAMHGAIAADAMRIPWIPVTTSPRILPFKWQDWCASIGVEYAPHRLTTQVNPRNKADLLTPLRSARYWVRNQSALVELAALTRVTPTLSSDAALERVVSELEERIGRFKADVNACKYRYSTDGFDSSLYPVSEWSAA